MLNEENKALEDEVRTFKEMEPKRIQHDFEFAMGALHVEAANTIEDYMEAFVELMTRGLKGHLKKDVKFSTCFEREPEVEVTVNPLNNEKEKKELLKDCPSTVE